MERYGSIASKENLLIGAKLVAKLWEWDTHVLLSKLYSHYNSDVWFIMDRSI